MGLAYHYTLEAGEGPIQVNRPKWKQIMVWFKNLFASERSTDPQPQPVAGFASERARRDSLHAIVAVLLLFFIGCVALTGKSVSEKKLRGMSDEKLEKFCDKARERSDHDCYRFGQKSGMAKIGCENSVRAAEKNVYKCDVEVRIRGYDNYFVFKQRR